MDQDPIQCVISQFDLIGILPHGKPNAIGMWPNEQECLIWAASQTDPNCAWVEIGSFCGGSALLLGYTSNFWGGNNQIFAIDAAFNPMFDLNVKRSKLDNIVKIEDTSFMVLGEWSIHKPISFLFLDGYHSFRNVVTEFELAQSHFTDDIIVAFHDCSPNMWTHNDHIIETLTNNAYAMFDNLMNSTEEDFYIDEAIAYICSRYNYEIIDIPIREPLAYHKETGLNGWVRGRTSPHNAFTAIRKTK